MAPAGAYPALMMEQVQGKAVYESQPTSEDILMDTFNWLDDFFERKLFRFLIVAVPLYFGAHLINYLIRK